MATLALQTGLKNTILRKRSEEVSQVNNDIQKLILNMKTSMKKEKGIGLAAPQVGVNKRIIIATVGDEVLGMVNPKILSFSAECAVEEEGCLSLPGEFGKVSRAKRVLLQYLDENGRQQQRELNNLDARVVQHEIDHLNGILFADRVLPGSLTQEDILSPKI
ncbi:peptide deformylase [Candidatus Peregrinibacteria bacterium]|nr:MAG: peptide deformylase [Candidatus Peregrinibacteria bacterium]